MIRLFIGLGLVSDVREGLWNAVSALGIRGQLTPKENYHLTLAFLGGHDERLRPLEGILSAAARESMPPTLTITGLGFFGRRESALLYAKLKVSQPLNVLADFVRQLLSEAGEPFDDKPFAAHITLARKADLTAANLHTPLPLMSFPVSRLTLYHSVRVQGILCYRPMFEAEFSKV